MRRLLFLLSCGLALSVSFWARDAVRAQPPAPATADDASVLTLAQRSHVVSTQFEAGLGRLGVHVHHVNHALNHAANGLTQLAGD